MREIGEMRFHDFPGADVLIKSGIPDRRSDDRDDTGPIIERYRKRQH